VQFQTFLESLGLTGFEELHPMAYLDICYLDHCLLTDPEMERLERQVHDILFPTVEFRYEDHAARAALSTDPPFDKRWLNAKCDVHAIWSHIWHRADIFVTEDVNFHKATKKPRLVALGAGQVCSPSECVSVLQAAGTAR
jgi:hypothetical protein